MNHMIIDAHTHVSFNSLLDGGVKGLIESMRHAGIAKACVFAGELNNCSIEKLLEALKEYRTTLFPIGSLSPLSQKKPSLKRVDTWLKRGEIHGLKLYPGYEYFYPSERKLRPYLELCAQYGKPVIFHSGDTYRKIKHAKLKYAHPLAIDDLATEMPTLKIVIAHMGYPWITDAAEVCYKNENVYADFSGFVYGVFTTQDKRQFKQLVKQFMQYTGGVEKLLFGTDWPVSEQKAYVDVVRSIFSAKDQKSIFSENAMKVFNM